jgi:hypothetical protein
VSGRYVPVPAAAIRERLTAAGFHLLADTRGEEVYERPHNSDPRYTVKVYSSIQRGAGEVRECGADAIRVVALFADAKFRWPAQVVPIFKAARVYRTGSVEAVLDRMIERAREAYATCNAHRSGKAAAE